MVISNLYLNFSFQIYNSKIITLKKQLRLDSNSTTEIHNFFMLNTVIKCNFCEFIKHFSILSSSHIVSKLNLKAHREQRLQKKLFVEQ